MLGTDRQHGDVGEGRKIEGTAHFQFLSRVAVRIMMPCILQGGGLRGERLDNDFPGQVSAACAARHLRQELEGAFACPRVGNVKAQVRIEHTHQCDARKIQAFGDHLGSQQNVYFTGPELVQDVSDGVFPPRHVCVHARDARRGKGAAQDFLHFLGTVALEKDAGGFAFRAGSGHQGLETAQMAHQAVFRAVVGEGKGTVHARDDVPAVRALDGTCESAAIEQQDHLLPPVQAAVDGHSEAFRKHIGAGFVFTLRFHVQNADQRQLLAVRTFRQPGQGVFSGLGVVDAFQGRRGGPQDDGAAFQMGAQDRQVAAVVAG